MLNEIMHSVNILNVVMLRVVMLTDVMLSVVLIYSSDKNIISFSFEALSFDLELMLEPYKMIRGLP